MSRPPEARAVTSRPTVILASQSPRRRELLSLIGIPHVVRPSDIDETAYMDEAPAPHAERLAREKALTLSRRETAAVVIGADTIVVIDGEILGKPRDVEDARRMLRQLGGRTHTVFTATAVARGDRVMSAIDAVSVTFRPLSEVVIDAYIATGEPMDKAGAYGIQGYGATLVERIDGDYFSVMGLALGRLIELCAAHGLGYEFGALFER
jgi:septum formation protein